MTTSDDSKVRVVCTRCTKPLPLPHSWLGLPYKYCQKCDPSTEEIKFKRYNMYWVIDYHYTTCLECGRRYKKPGCPHMNCTPISTCTYCDLFYCEHCDPSYNDIVFTFSEVRGWHTAANRYTCLTCKEDVYSNTSRHDSHLPFYCKKCDPSDDHNRYVYSKKHMSYVLQQVWLFDYSTRKHSWKFGTIKTECVECKRKKVFKEQINFYLNELDSDREAPKARLKIKAKNSSSKYISIERDILACPVGMMTKITHINWDVCVLVYEFAGYSFTETRMEDLNLRRGNYNAIDFSKSSFIACNLSRADFSNCTLTKVSFDYSDLRNIDWTNTHLESMSFVGTNLSGVNFVGRSLTKCNFTGANLRGANLDSTRIYDSILVGADLTEASFREAYLYQVNLAYANLTKASFTKADLEVICCVATIINETSFEGSLMCHVNLSKSLISKANFSGADLLEANLNNLNLDECLFDRSKLAGASFNKSSFVGASLIYAICFKTKMRDTNFEKAFLCNIGLEKCALERASFVGAHLMEAIIIGCSVEDTVFKECNFTNANIVTTQLDKAKLRKCTFTHTRLNRAITPAMKEKFSEAIIDGFCTY